MGIEPIAALADRIGERLFRPGMRRMDPFDPREPLGALRMHLNEGLPPDPAWAELIAGEVRRVLAGERSFAWYPPIWPERIARAYARFLGVPLEQVEITAGASESILLLSLGCFFPGRRVALPTPSYYLFGKCANIFEAEQIPYPLPLPFAERAEETYRALFRPEVLGADVTIFCNPNNPTGSMVPRPWIEEFLRRTAGVVLVDEAYVEYAEALGERSFAADVSRHPNLIVLRTMSKAWGAAGLRLGAVVADPSVIHELGKLRTYRMSILSQAVGTWLLENHEATMRAQVERTHALRRRLVAAAGGMPGLEVFDTKANFVVLRHGDGARLESELLAEGLAVRALAGGDLDGAVRVSLPDEAGTERLIAALGAWTRRRG